MSRTDRDYLILAAEHLEVLHRHLDQGSVDDQLVLDAAALRLSAAIDSVSQVTEILRRRTINDARWRAIKSMRNRIAHAYGFINPSVLRASLDRDVAEFEANIHELIAIVDEAGDLRPSGSE